ncbi:MAG TPA: hypothetical protein VN715_01710 [Roseiarcus sp.]|nr:hypothetical protein [Roseiarcus sp.]
MSFWAYRDYVSVAQRRAEAAREVQRLKKQGRVISPVVIDGRKIATRFWGKSWCENLERYSDFANRLPRGRTYVNNGSVVDLQVSRGKVEALVSGSEIYKVKVEIAVAAPSRWKAICADCAGSVGSIVELLQGKLSAHVMSRVCRAADGLFPAPGEIKMSCSCPDWADMCKHVAATLYGVGARLDVDPDVLFALRGVERGELVSTGADLSITQAAAASERVLAEDDLAALFGVEIEASKALPLKTALTGKSAAAPVVKAKSVAAKAPARQTPLGRPTRQAETARVRGTAPAAFAKLEASLAIATPAKPVVAEKSARSGRPAKKPVTADRAQAKIAAIVKTEKSAAAPQPRPAAVKPKSVAKKPKSVAKSAPASKSRARR